MKKKLSEIIKGDRFRVFDDVHVAAEDAALASTEMGSEWVVRVEDEKGFVWGFTCENGEVEYIPLSGKEEETKTVIEALKQLQQADENIFLPCPRCGRMTMRQPATTNALSRYADVYICSGCGMDEALRDFTGLQPLPFTEWNVVKKEKRENLPSSVSDQNGSARIAIRVKGGLVQAVYSTVEDVDVEVYDLDVSGCPDESEMDIVEERRRQLEMIEKSPDWKLVW